MDPVGPFQMFPVYLTMCSEVSRYYQGSALFYGTGVSIHMIKSNSDKRAYLLHEFPGIQTPWFHCAELDDQKGIALEVNTTWTNKPE